MLHFVHTFLGTLHGDGRSNPPPPTLARARSQFRRNEAMGTRRASGHPGRGTQPFLGGAVCCTYFPHGVNIPESTVHSLFEFRGHRHGAMETASTRVPHNAHVWHERPSNGKTRNRVLKLKSTICSAARRLRDQADKPAPPIAAHLPLIFS